jgi:hypothetical protein
MQEFTSLLKNSYFFNHTSIMNVVAAIIIIVIIIASILILVIFASLKMNILENVEEKWYCGIVHDVSLVLLKLTSSSS